MLDYVAEVSPALNGNPPVSVAASRIWHAEAVCCEPERRKVLIIEDGADTIELIEMLLRHMSRFEPLITTTVTLEAGRLAVASDDFDLVVLSVGEDRAHDALEISETTLAAVLVTPAPCPIVRRTAARQGTPCIALADASPSVFQDMLCP